MTSSEMIPAIVLKRKAVVYVRQSTQSQVVTNLEGKRRQYDLVDVARQHGFVDVEGDLLRLTWKAYNGEFIRLRQSKTGRSMEILVGAPLKAALDVTPKTSPFVIASDDNRPYTSDGFRASWSKICKRAGIKGLTFHDLRGTAVTRMAQTGCTELEIAAVTGHAVSDVRSILDKHYYSRDPSIAKRAIQKLETRTKPANRGANQRPADRSDGT